MKLLNEQSFQEICDGFLEGKYSFYTDEYQAASSELENKMEDIESLVPLLCSTRFEAQTAATYIASLVAGRAKPIFEPYLFNLIDSPWFLVKFQVCDALSLCTTEPKHVAKLFSLFKDKDKRIRVKILLSSTRFNYDALVRLSKYIAERNDSVEYSFGLSILLEQMRNGIKYSELESVMLSSTVFDKYFAYIAAYYEFGKSKQLDELAYLAKNSDILWYHEIYNTIK